MSAFETVLGPIMRAGLTWLSRRRLPQTSGTLNLQELQSPVEIIRDLKPAALGNLARKAREALTSLPPAVQLTLFGPAMVSTSRAASSPTTRSRAWPSWTSCSAPSTWC